MALFDVDERPGPQLHSAPLEEVRVLTNERYWR